jgi:hypothetical protein
MYGTSRMCRTRPYLASENLATSSRYEYLVLVLESYRVGYDRSNRRLPAAPPSREGRQQQQPQPAAGSRSGREHAPPVAS